MTCLTIFLLNQKLGLCEPDYSGRFWKGRVRESVGCPGFKYPSDRVKNTGKSLLLSEPVSSPAKQGWWEPSVGLLRALCEGKAGYLTSGMPSGTFLAIFIHYFYFS